MTENSAPVLETLAAMTAASLEHSTLDNDTLILLRLAALAAVDAPPASYFVNAGAAADAGITVEGVQEVLVAVAPIIGTARVASAVTNILKGLGLAIAALDAELELVDSTTP